VTLQWGSLEDEMAQLLTALLSGKRYAPMGYYIYFSPDNSATRFDIVAAAFRCNVEDLFDQDLAKKITELWASFFNSLGRGRRARNNVTHGVVREVEIGRSKRPGMRLAPSGFDPHRRPAQNNQVVGRSAAEVEDAAEKIRELRFWARDFNEFARWYHTHPDNGAWPKILAALERHRRRHDDQTSDAPTLPKPSD